MKVNHLSMHNINHRKKVEFVRDERETIPTRLKLVVHCDAGVDVNVIYSIEKSAPLVFSFYFDPYQSFLAEEAIDAISKTMIEQASDIYTEWREVSREFTPPNYESYCGSGYIYYTYIKYTLRFEVII